MLGGILICGFASAQGGRDYVYIVGSSTVYPFATVVARLVRWTAAKALHRAYDRSQSFHLGLLVEVDQTDRIFTNPKHKLTEDYITGRIG